MQKEIIAGRNFYFLPAPFMTLKVSVDERYNSIKMKKAIEKLELAHPTINNVIVKDGSRMFLQDNGSHVSLTELPVEHSENWKDVVAKVVQKPIDLQKKPGVMVYVVNNGEFFDLILFCHHIYGDGISLKNLMGDLLYIYSTGHKVGSREGKITLSEEDLPEGCKIPVEMKTAMSGLMDTWNQRRVDFSFEDYEKMVQLHNEDVGYGMVHRRIKGSLYRKLKGKCRELEVTLNSAITTAMAKALLKEDKIEAVIAADTRSTFHLTNNKGMANCASCVRPVICYDDSVDFWTNVKRVDAEIKSERANLHALMSTFQVLMLLDGDILSAGYFAQYGLYQDQEVLGALVNALGLGSGMDSFDVSNIGLAQFESDNEDFKLRHCCYIPNVTMTCDCTFGAITLDNVMDISLAYKANKFPPCLAEETMDTIVSILTDEE